MLGRALLALLVAVLGVLVPSCVNLYELDGYSGATAGLCDKLAECFGEGYFPACRDYADPRLSGAQSADRQAWLVMFADTGCLESCAAARECLDQLPLCGGVASGCTQDEHCCGFTSGAGECGGGACCKPRGIGCASDAECCAAAEGEQPNDCTTSEEPGSGDKFCGGVPCEGAGKKCDDGFECCTKVCLDGFCAENTCLPIGSSCSANGECCDGYCALGGLAEEGRGPGICTEASCKGDGAPCTTAEECCGQFCVKGMSGQQICSSGACLPDEAICTEGANECCSGFCDTQFLRCSQGCHRPGGDCTLDDDCCHANCDEESGVCTCLEDGDACEEHSDCCSGVCNDNFRCGLTPCLEAFSVCSQNDASCCSGHCEQDERSESSQFLCCDDAGCTHTLCTEGAPLARACNCDECGDTLIAASCINEVCNARPHCCCFGWDADCVKEAKLTCNFTCPDIDVDVDVATPLPKP